MNLKGYVPLFNTEVDATNAEDLAEKGGGMILGVMMFFIVVALGKAGFDQLNSAAGTDAEAGIPIAGDN